MNLKSFQTPTFKIHAKDSDDYAERYDGNPVHQPGNSNEILPENTVPGLLVASYSFKKVLELKEFAGILCAKEASVKFLAPVFRDDEVYVRGTYTDSPHRTRPNVIFRISHCEVMRSKTNALLMKYDLTQLFRGA